MKLNNIPAISGVLLGIFLAAADYHINIPSALCLLLSAILMQMLSDTCATALAKKNAKTVYVLLIIASALGCLYLSFGALLKMESLVLMVIVYFSLRYATHFRITASPGTGDIYRFLLYGPAALYGTYFVCSHSFGSSMLLFPALTSGMFSICVLSSVQTPVSDRSTGIYRISLIAAGMISMTVYSFLRIFDIKHFLFLLTLPLFVWACVMIVSRKEGLRTLLPYTVLLFTLLTCFGYIAFLFC